MPTPQKRWLDRIRRICLALPEASEKDHFGARMWFAGKKGFCGLRRTDERTYTWFKPNADELLELLEDPRFEEAPGAMGRTGWVMMTLEDPIDWDEVAEFVIQSYRQNALKRMLKALEES